MKMKIKWKLKWKWKLEWNVMIIKVVMKWRWKLKLWEVGGVSPHGENSLSKIVTLVVTLVTLSVLFTIGENFPGWWSCSEIYIL